MIIAQISDTHIDLDIPDRANRLRDLERCVAAINRLDPGPDVVIHTGDLVHNGKPAEYESVKRILQSLRCPVHVAVGNRDDRAAMRAAFPVFRNLLLDKLFVQYIIDTFPVQLIVLDTQSASGNQGDFCQTRADNLHAALAGSAKRPTAIFMHHPPFEVVESDYPHQFKPWESVERLDRALNGHRHVAGIFCGHSHRDANGEVGGVPVSSMPSVAVDLRLGRQMEQFASNPVFKLHQFDGLNGFSSRIHVA